jgi:Zn-dependent protease with chaperone function
MAGAIQENVVTAVALLFSLAVVMADAATLQAMFGSHAADVLDYALTGIWLLVLPLGIFIYRFFMAAVAKSNAIRVGPAQMPQIWAMYQSLGERLEMSRLPRLYVTNGNGVVNAYALSCNRRHKYVVLHSEVALLIDSLPEAVEFVLAHELGHHKLNHVSLWRIAIGLVPNLLPPLGISTVRAQEYSADRVAMKVCGHHDGAMKLLAVGPWIPQKVDREAWLAQCDEEHREFFVRIANLASSHAVMVKRFKALDEIGRKGFGTQGEMF